MMMLNEGKVINLAKARKSGPSSAKGDQSAVARIVMLGSEQFRMLLDERGIPHRDPFSGRTFFSHCGITWQVVSDALGGLTLSCEDRLRQVRSWRCWIVLRGGLCYET